MIYTIMEVLYAPHKAFKEIVQEPKYIGLILILVLFIATSTMYGYTILSKSYVEKILPNVDPSIGQFDTWTENSTMWSSPQRAEITEDFNDFINGSYYGNRSIVFSVPKSSKISMTLMEIGPVNCSGPEGYKNLSLRIKIVDPKIVPSTASIYLFSGKGSNYFYYNLTDSLSRSTAGAWINLTIPLATENWVKSNGDWSNITGVGLAFDWPKDYNISVLVDGLYFRGIFKTPIEIDATGYLLSYSVSSLLQFTILWFSISGIIFIVLRIFRVATVWKPILVSVGSALIILSVQALVNMVAVLLTLANIYYPLEYFGGTMTEMIAVATKMSEQASLFLTVRSYIEIAIYTWITLLCTIANRLLTQLSWTKSFLASAVALFFAHIINTLFVLL